MTHIHIIIMSNSLTDRQGGREAGRQAGGQTDRRFVKAKNWELAGIPLPNFIICVSGRNVAVERAHVSYIPVK